MLKRCKNGNLNTEKYAGFPELNPIFSQNCRSDTVILQLENNGKYFYDGYGLRNTGLDRIGGLSHFIP